MASDTRPASVSSGLQMSCAKSPSLCLGGGAQRWDWGTANSLKGALSLLGGEGREGAGLGQECVL